MSKAKTTVHPSRPDIDFDELLSKGADTYDSAVGHWWQARSLDLAHRKAYSHIAQYTAQYAHDNDFVPRTILDYACGGGAFLGELQREFPESHLIGLDGSIQLLKECANAHNLTCSLLPHSQAFVEHPRHVCLTRTALPNFELPANTCDIVFLVFPNLVPDPKHLGVFNRNGYGNLQDNKVARMLARFREMDPEEETVVAPADELFDDYMTARVFSRNLRHLVRKGGLVVKVDYSQANRKELTQLTQWRNLFCEGALEEPIKGELAEPMFHLVASEYRKSKVILDVFHQTGDPDDSRGGYMVSIFTAV